MGDWLSTRPQGSVLMECLGCLFRGQSADGGDCSRGPAGFAAHPAPLAALLLLCLSQEGGSSGVSVCAFASPVRAQCTASLELLPSIPELPGSLPLALGTDHPTRSPSSDCWGRVWSHVVPWDTLRGPATGGGGKQPLNLSKGATCSFQMESAMAFFRFWMEKFLGKNLKFPSSFGNHP